MATNVIEQIVTEGEFGTQTIQMIVHPNERGPQGEQGEQGRAATIHAGNAYSVPVGQNPAVINTGDENEATFDFYIPKGEKGEPGKDGSFQYTAGVGIKIQDGVISALGSGGGMNVWGLIEGNIADQTDLAPYIRQIAPRHIWHGTCSTATGTLYKDVTITGGNFQYTVGDLVVINFAKPETATAGVYIRIGDNAPYRAYTLPWDNNNLCQVFICDTNNNMRNIRGLAATVDAYGQTKLYDGHDSSSQVLAATANSVKQVYDAIPTVNNATLTIQSNGVSAGTFTANSATNTTINITSPTITLTDTDPGEGAPLAANNFIAYYEA